MFVVSRPSSVVGRAYQARSQGEQYDWHGARFIGALLGASVFALIITVLGLSMTDNDGWLSWLLLGCGAFFAWLIRPRK